MRTTTYDPVHIVRILKRADEIGARAAAQENGLDPNTVQKWRRKRRDSGGAWPSEQDIRSWHARTDLRAKWRRQKIQQLTHTPGVVDPTGTVRRLRALYALGWTWDELGAHLGGGRNRAHRIAHERDTSRGVLRETAIKVAEMYEQLCMTRPEGWIADRARGAARRNGWPPPLAWDNIDDPKEKPRGFRAAKAPLSDVDPVTVDRIVGGEYDLYATPAERVEVVRRWRADGRSLADLERKTGWNANRYRPREEVA